MSEKEAQIIQVPNSLRAKLGPGKGIDKALVQKADEAIKQQAGAFLERLVGEIQRLDGLAEELERATDRETRSAIQQSIYAGNHEMRGEAGTYGFSLVSAIANALCRYVEDLPERQFALPTVVRAHTHALRAAIRDDIPGDGGPVGKELLTGLQLLVDKMRNK